MSISLAFVTTILMGLCSFGFASWLTWYFYKLDHKISRALTAMLAAEAIACLCTVVFAISTWISFVCPNSYLGGLSNFVLSDEGATVLRWLIFFPATCSSIHLLVTINSLTEEK